MRAAARFALAAAATLVAGCSVLDTTLPVTGTVENGVYAHADGAFTCPLPTSEQGFSGAPEIRDAVEIIKTVRRVVPADERRPGEPSMRDEIVYPIKIKPATSARFTDPDAPDVFLEITFRRMQARDTVDDVLRSGYGGGNLGLLREARRERGGRTYGLAVAQLPYWEKGMSYMGFDFWEGYLHGDEPGPDIDAIANFVEDDRHYFFVLRASSLDFLPGDVNPKDLMAVRAALIADPTATDVMEERLLGLMDRCTFADWTREETE